MSTVATITGLTEVQKMLTDAPGEIVLLSFQKGLSAAGEVIAQEIFVRTPEREDENTRPDDQIPLREDISAVVTLDASGRGGVVAVGFKKMAYVARFLEYGHRMIGHEPDKKLLHGKKAVGGFVKAQPFMRGAAEVATDRAVQAFQDAVAAALKDGI